MPNLLKQLQQKQNSLDSFFSAKKLINRIKNNNYNRNLVKLKKDKPGYTKRDLEQNKKIHKQFDPTGGIGIIDYIANKTLGGNLASGEEDQYWRAYLGLQNNLPLANRQDLTEWDYNDEKKNKKHSDFYGITPKMKYYIEAMADSTGLGKLVRNGHEDHRRLYEFSKKLLNNPWQWQQATDEILPKHMSTATKNQGQGEFNPLGMLANFGMKWDPLQQKVYVHDTYDFPQYTRFSIPERPNEMKIRGSADYSPYIGSTYYRTNGDTKYVPKSITQK